MKALETFCRNTDATDETIELLLIEVKQLAQIIATQQEEQVSETTEAAAAPLPKKLNTDLILSYLSLEN
jgi:hypothetical protein